MKLSHLSLAVLSAIALAACGGSSNGVQTTPDQNNTGNTGGTTGGNTGDTGGTTGGNTGDTGGTTGGNTGDTGGTTGGNTGDTGGTTGGNTGNTGGTTGGNTGNTGGTTGDTGGNTDDQNDTDDGNTGGNTDDQNDTDDGNTGGNTGDGSTGGNTGDGSTGGNTGDGSTGGGSTGGGNTGDGSTTQQGLSPDAVSSLNQNGEISNYYQPTATTTFPNQVGTQETTAINRPANNPAGTALLNKATSEAFIPNPALVDDDNELPSNFLAGGAARQSNWVYYKDASGSYVQAWASSAPNDPTKVFYYPVNAAGTAANNTAAPLKATELYQIADLTATTAAVAAGARDAVPTPSATSFSDVSGFKVFDQTLANPARMQGKIDRTKIKQGEVIQEDVNAIVDFTSVKLSPTVAGTAQGVQVGADGQPALIKKTQEFKVGEVKAYNLPHTLTTVSMSNGNLAGPVGANTSYFSTFYNQGAVNVAGLRTLELPQNVSATYKGKVFTAASEGDLSLDVEFGVTNSAYVKNVQIVNRKNTNNNVTPLEDLANIAPAAVNYQGNGNNVDDYTVNLQAADGTNPPTGLEFNQLGGKFYGKNAEETAGSVYTPIIAPVAGGPTTRSVGAFAAQRGDLK